MQPFIGHHKLFRTLFILSLLHLTIADQDEPRATADSDEDLETDTMIKEILGVQPKDVIPVADQESSFPLKTQRISGMDSGQPPQIKETTTSKPGAESSLRNQILIQQELNLAQAKLKELGKRPSTS